MPTSAKKMIEKYCSHLCETGDKPKTVTAFCKTFKFDEKDFYKNYASFENMEQHVFVSFFENTMTLLEKDEKYEALDEQNKLLTFYYTFFEVLLMNRTLVTLLLPKDSKKWTENDLLKGLKKEFQDYIASLGITWQMLDNTPLASYQDKGIRAIAWLQFIKTLDFWMKDQSKGFEKTDVYIEKSLRASFDLIQKNPFESLIDFGKFIYQEGKKNKI